MHTYMHDILNKVNECKHRVRTDRKDPGWAAPASCQVLARQEAGSGASRIPVALRVTTRISGNMCARSIRGVSVYAMFALNRCVFVRKTQVYLPTKIPILNTECCVHD